MDRAALVRRTRAVAALRPATAVAQDGAPAATVPDTQGAAADPLACRAVPGARSAAA